VAPVATPFGVRGLRPADAGSETRLPLDAAGVTTSGTADSTGALGAAVEGGVITIAVESDVVGWDAGSAV
jgi:hypothetical protein